MFKQQKLIDIGRQVSKLTRITGESVVEIGKHLIEAKQLCQHGEWETWLKEYFPYSVRTAQRFMAIADELSDLPNLNNYQPTALSLLASKSTPESVREQFIELGTSGEMVTPSVIKQAITEKQESELELGAEYDILTGIEDETDTMTLLRKTEDQSDTVTLLTKAKHESDTMTFSTEIKDESDTVTLLTKTEDKSDTMTLANNSKRQRNPDSFMPDCELKNTRHLTAMTRNDLSTPVKLAVQKGFITELTTHLDYGCGKAGDVVRLRIMGVDSIGYDPFFFPKNPVIQCDVVTCNYVVNVIEEEAERIEVIQKAYSQAKQVLIVAIRVDPPTSNVLKHKDGHVTSKGTFQKHYSNREAVCLIQKAIGKQPTTLAPGIFLVNKQATSK